MSEGLARCGICGNEITPAQRHAQYQRIRGWERIAGIRVSGKHGGSDIALRERLDEFAHGPCVAALKMGVSPAQETLI